MRSSNAKSISLVIGIILFIGVIFYIFTQPGKKPVERIRIGADITLTGKFGYFGQQFQKGLQLAEEFENSKAGQMPVEVLVQDNRHNAGEAVSIFEKFASVDHVCAVVSLYSPMSKAIKESAVRHQIPLVTTYTTAKDITNEWTFRDFPAMDEQVPPLAQVAYDNIGLRRVSCILYQTDFGFDARDIFQKSFEMKGGKLLRSEEIPLEGAENMVNDVVAKIIAGKPDGVFLVLSAKTLGLAAKRLRESKYEGAILSVVMFDSPEVRDIAKSAAEGVYFSGIPYDTTKDKKSQEFANAYKVKFSKAPDYMSVYGFTIGEYLIRIARDAKGDRALILKALKSLDVQSIRGRIRVLSDNSIQSPVGIFRVESTKNVLIK